MRLFNAGTASVIDERVGAAVGDAVATAGEVINLIETGTVTLVDEWTEASEPVVLTGGTINQKVAYLATQIGRAVDINAPIVILDDEGNLIQLNTIERRIHKPRREARGVAEQTQLLFRHLYGDPDAPGTRHRRWRGGRR